MVRKIVSSVVAAVIVMGTMAAQARAQAELDKVYSEQVQKAYMEAVVRIKADKSDSIAQGSGVWVAYDQDTGVAVILTAAHVVKDAKRLSFEVFTTASLPNPARKYSPPAKWWYDEKNDVAVIV